MRHIYKNSKTLNLTPRGFGKSTVGDVAYSLWRIIHDRNIRILICSNTQSQAEAFCREIKIHLERNERLLSLFGDFKSSKWAESEFNVSGRTSIAKESTVTALGATGAVISKHFDLIIADDIIDFENARTDYQRKKIFEWYRTALLPTLEPHGQIHVLGTRYNPTDMYQALIESGQYKVKTQQAILPDQTSLWPEKFRIDDLLLKRQELGSLIFDLQFQNDTTLARQGRIFRFEWMQFYDLAPEGLKIYQGVDLAISQQETADYFVIVTIGLDSDGNIYVLDVFRDRLSFKAQKEAIKLKAQQWHPTSIGIETNQYQRALSQELIRSTNLPVKDLQTQKDKVTRAQRRSALFENEKVFLRKDMTIFIDELCLFPDAAHDDAFDAFDFAVTISDETYYESEPFIIGI